MPAARPVILLAFANEAPDGINYLRNLSVEQRKLRTALERAKTQGLCDFELLYGATLDDILAAFRSPNLRGRIAVFHYGGHADSYELLFQGETGNLERIDGRGFAAFLAEQPSLQLVFLNACSTEPQVDSLLAANVQVVIATSQEIDDEVASSLAGQFYTELAHGATLGSAYRQSVAALRARKGDDPTLFYTRGAEPFVEPAEQETSAVAVPGIGGSALGAYWPWMLRTRPGAEVVAEWSLPLAIGDPLYGLPPLPPKPLPESPYQRALDYYTRDMAELFFGRGPQIRSLYQRVTAAGHSSVILYYGQSGVGKSSLLDAGLAPRLDPTHIVSYARRDRALGLLGTLRRQLTALVPSPGAGQPAAADQPTVAETWRAAEQAAGKPIVLILDQVEEVFTRRNPEQPSELQDFVAALRSIDGGQNQPQGALLLGFRKEHLAEIVSALRDQRVAFVGQYLAPLDAAGIEEVVRGPTITERLRSRYGLTMDDDLPQLIAHDLSADPESPVAPTLNILLRKLWAAATAAAAGSPHFSVVVYERLRREGILLDDFLRQQSATIAQEQPASVASGLLLDLWAFHTTALGTSDHRDAAELRHTYGERSDLDALILRSKELYVLADPPGDSARGRERRLAHDTLAPLVRRDFEHSTLPGQQARRLLESRAVDWSDGQTGAVLDDAALAVVEKGLDGMRSLTTGENRLLAASRDAQARRRHQRSLWLLAAAGAAVIIVGLIATVLLFRYNQQVAETRLLEERIAEHERTQGMQLTQQLTIQREIAARNQGKINESQRIAQLAQQQLDVDPVVGLHLALAANSDQLSVPGTSVPEAEYVLRQAVLTSRERKYVPASVRTPDQVAIGDNRIAVGGASPAVYDLELDAQDFVFPSDLTNVQGLRWDDEEQRLLGWNDQAVWVMVMASRSNSP